MNSAASSPPDTSTISSPQPVAPEDRELMAEVPSSLSFPEIRREGRDLILLHGATLPTRICIRSGRPAFRVVEVALRNPRNPRTWFGRRPRLKVGLSRKQYENHAVATALTWSFLALGLLLLVAGFLAGGWVASSLGLLTLVFSGLFRACSPVTCSAQAEESIAVRGACPSFLRKVCAEISSSK